MNEYKKPDLKAWLQNRKGKKDQWLILLLLGILLVVIAVPASTGGEAQETAQEEMSGDETEDSDSYARLLERRLENALIQVKGVGKVSVMITLSSSREKIVEKDQETSTDSSGEAQGAQSKSTSASETSVYSGQSGSQSPYVKKTLSPDIGGVMIIAEGGDNPVVVENITEAVQALFGVDTHKIKVMKRS